MPFVLSLLRSPIKGDHKTLYLLSYLFFDHYCAVIDKISYHRSWRFFPFRIKTSIEFYFFPTKQSCLSKNNLVRQYRAWNNLILVAKKLWCKYVPYLNLEIQKSQYINMRKLFKGGNYMRKYGKYCIDQNVNVVIQGCWNVKTL